MLINELYCESNLYYTHWIDVEAENEEDEFNRFIELQPTFVSDLEDMEMEIV